MVQELNKVSQLQIGKDIRVELQIPPSPNVDLTTPRWGSWNVRISLESLKSKNPVLKRIALNHHILNI